MLLMFGLGLVVIISGLMFNHADFAAAYQLQHGTQLEPMPHVAFNFNTFLGASAILFSSFIGFDSIAQAGGEAKNPRVQLPLAIGLAMITVSLYYFTFTTSVYHAVPWHFIAGKAAHTDITAPGVLSLLIPAGWNVAIIAGAAVALTNDLPAMLLAVSRLVFAWSADGIFPKRLSETHPRFHSPHRALVLSGVMASIGIAGSHFAGDFFLGVDIMVLAMLVNFLVMCISVIALPHRNALLAAEVKVVTSRTRQLVLAWLGIFFIGGFLIIHMVKDLQATVDHWYFRSTPVWFLVMAAGSLIYWREFMHLKKTGTDVKALFKKLPAE
jgi:amino acid transporter